MFPNLVNISCTHGQKQVPALCIFEKVILDRIEGTEVVGGGSEGLNLFPKGIGSDAQIVGLAGSIDISQHDLVSHGESFGEIIH